jgi:quercetin dioxygenase-like cupin family protein
MSHDSCWAVEASAPKNGSMAFTNTAKNRDSLEPVPSRLPDGRCLHRDVANANRGGDNSFAAERGHPVFPVKLPSNTVSLSVGELAPGKATSNHRHAYESLVYVLEGEGYTIMEGQRFDWRVGDAFYTPPWCWHQHFAAPGSHVRYLTATNMPLLHSMGQTVLREEERVAREEAAE